jgi:hypothetical protein
MSAQTRRRVGEWRVTSRVRGASLVEIRHLGNFDILYLGNTEARLLLLTDALKYRRCSLHLKVCCLRVQSAVRGARDCATFALLMFLSENTPYTLLSTHQRMMCSSIISTTLTLRLTPAIRSHSRLLKAASILDQKRWACNGSKVRTECPSKVASTLPLSSRHFWGSSAVWRRAGVNTLRCLIGCTAGDFSAMWYLQSFHADLGLTTIMALSSKTDAPKFDGRMLTITSGLWHHHITPP